MSLMYLKQVTSDERVHYALFLIVLGLALLAEIRSWHIFLLPQYFRAKRFLSRLRSLIRDYQSAKYYKPWKPSNPIVIVSTKKQIAELSEASSLSQRAVYADMFGFKHTMNKLEHNTNDHKVLRTRLYSRLLQVNGPVHLQALYPRLITRLDSNLSEEFRDQEEISLPVAPVVRRLASRLMSLMFFGETLSSNREFSNALLNYSRDMVRCMAAFQVTPAFMSPVIHAILTRRGQAMHLVQGQLLDCMGSDGETWNEEENTKRLTIMHGMVSLTKNSEYWSPELLAQSLLGIWFAASHQPWMNLNFVLLELCIREDWQAALRKEIEQHAPLDYKVLEQLPLLDAFIKETVRLNPLDTLAIRRKALEPYTFSGGSLSVPANATVCVSAYDLMHDPRTYTKPDSFLPSRFLSDSSGEQRKFTEVSETFPVWGYGSLACPGRFHASLVIKMVLSQLLLRYDLKLENQKARTRWSWETFTMPYESTRVNFTRRRS